MNAAEIEQTKLTATYLNGIAIAILAVGAFAPAAIAFGGTLQLPPAAIAVQALGCFTASFILRLAGRRVLRRLAA